MKIEFNGEEYPLQLVDTEFAAYWHDWFFHDATRIEVEFGRQERLAMEYQNWTGHAQRLTNLIELNNTIVTTEGLPERYIYEVQDWDKLDVDYLVRTHEQWAQITKEACEVHLPVYNDETYEIYAIINDLMQESNEQYPNINSYVHQVEFVYKFFYLHNMSIQHPAMQRGDYVIKPEDTSFVRQTVCLPYFDIGRPQFEKYIVSGAVNHDEISNYIALANRVEFTASVIQEYVPQDFYDMCEAAGVPAYGNFVNVATTVDRNPSTIGQFFMHNYVANGENTIGLVA